MNEIRELERRARDDARRLDIHRSDEPPSVIPDVCPTKNELWWKERGMRRLGSLLLNAEKELERIAAGERFYDEDQCPEAMEAARLCVPQIRALKQVMFEAADNFDKQAKGLSDANE